MMYLLVYNKVIYCVYAVIKNRSIFLSDGICCYALIYSLQVVCYLITQQYNTSMIFAYKIFKVNLSFQNLTYPHIINLKFPHYYNPTYQSQIHSISQQKQLAIIYQQRQLKLIIQNTIKQTMTRMSVLTLMSFIMLLSVIHCHKRIYYLYEDEIKQDKAAVQALKNNRENHPVYTIDCKKLNCAKFKVHHYPALIFWNGPGTSYKSLYPVNHDGLEKYFISQQQHPLKTIRDFIEGISLLQAFAVAIAVATFLFGVFSVLFKDRSGLEEAKSKKDL